MDNANKLGNILIVMLTVIGTVSLLALGAFGFWFFQNKLANKPLPSSSSAPAVSLPPSAAPVISSAPSASIISSPAVPTKSDLELIKDAFSAKYSRPASECKPTISKQQGNYISGGITFEGEMGGGWFLAYKEGGKWKIVADGNGTVMCADIEPYNFPVSMVPECWDEATSKLIER